MAKKTWFGDVLETHAPKFASVAGAVAGGAAGSAIMPGQGTALGAAAGGALAGGATTHGIRWLRRKWGFDTGGQVSTTPGSDAFAIVHNGELILKREVAEKVKRLMIDSGLHIPAVRQLPSITEAVMDGARVEMAVRRARR